jgi:hypothetical protein
MKSTQIERQWLKDYLNQVMEYRETFEEVYDHILLSLNHEPEEQHFETAVSNIIERDFGGYNGLLAHEMQCRYAAEETAKAQHWSYFKQWFSSRYAIISLAAFALLFWLQHYKYVFRWMPVLFFLLFFAPLCIAAKQWINANYINNTNKQSIKDEVSSNITFKIYFNLFKLIIICNIFIVIIQYMFNTGSFAESPADKLILPSRNAFVFNVIISISSAVFVSIIACLATRIQLSRISFKPNILPIK